MSISGFSMVKNADKLYYPIVQAIESILPIVDEFIIAIGDCDADDRTRELVAAIDSPKVKIIDTVWDLEKYPNGTENAHQTNIARKACSGDWLFYLQADEVVHEKYLPIIKARCEELVDNHKVEGLLFNYIHFWGDYQHHMDSHSWYPHEIRIIRNHPDIHSWESAQSFRRIPNFDEQNFRQQKGTHMLNVAKVDAYIYHYGWVRPPKLMQNKKKSLDTIHQGADKVKSMYQNQLDYFDYGPLKHVSIFEGTHPKVMGNWMARFDWAHQLNYGSKRNPNTPKFKHEKLKYKALSFVENKLLGGKKIGSFKNYKLLDV